jgi:hypothetical protein
MAFYQNLKTSLLSRLVLTVVTSLGTNQDQCNEKKKEAIYSELAEEIQPCHLHEQVS